VGCKQYCEGSDTARDVSGIGKEVSDIERGIIDTVGDVRDTAKEVIFRGK
jgi:hypothetical protein